MDNTEIPIIIIRKDIVNQMGEYFANDVEKGCLIGSSCYLNQIDRWAPIPGIADHHHFVPDMDAVNRQIAQWMNDGICFCGFFHSHPNGAAFLSYADHIAIESWVCAANLPFLCFGVADCSANLKLYLAQKEENKKVSVFCMQKATDLDDSEYIHWRSNYE